MPEIREYRPEDIEQVHACFVELQDFLHRLEPNILAGRAAGKYFDFMLARCAETSGKVFVAEVDNQVVGFVCVWGKSTSEDLDEEPVEYAFISDLVVLPAYRSQGIGPLLLQAAEAYARAQGAASLELEVLVKNEPALRVYNRHGFRAYHYLFKKDLR
jgi:ribosomal protein S18 acetylase RimI-like enzyme